MSDHSAHLLERGAGQVSQDCVVSERQDLSELPCAPTAPPAQVPAHCLSAPGKLDTIPQGSPHSLALGSLSNLARGGLVPRCSPFQRSPPLYHPLLCLPSPEDVGEEQGMARGQWAEVRSGPGRH